MTVDLLRNNLNQMKEIVRELYVFSGQLKNIESLEKQSNIVINTTEKKLLNDSVSALVSQLRILNNSLPGLLNMIKFYQGLDTGIKGSKPNLIQVQYKPNESEEVSLAIDNNFKKEFLENLSKSNLSINQLRKKYSVVKPEPVFGKPNWYAKISNRLFRDFASGLIAKGTFDNLNKDLRKINSPFIIRTYVSIVLFTVLISFFSGLFLFGFLLFFEIGLSLPFISFSENSILRNIVTRFWIIFAIPLLSGIFIYFYPSSEAKNIGSKIDQELPFITIHMSAIATSGVEPVNIFRIILKSKDYKYTNRLFVKIMNLINFHGENMVSALRKAAVSSPSGKLRELLDGMATTITSGGDLHTYLDKRAERLLFDYKLEREKYIRSSETFMDIYISIVIAAPMIFLMLFVIIGSAGLSSGFLGLSTPVLGLLIILMIVFLNIGFLVFLKLKQPVI